MAVDGLIIPRSYNDYINKTDPIALSQALKQNNALDDAPTEDSRGGVRSGGVFDALAGKQPTLTFDNTPTDGSSNPVTSDGIYDALAGKQDTLTFDNTPTVDSDNPVKSSGLVNSVPVDEVTSSNMHAVTSNAVAEKFKYSNGEGTRNTSYFKGNLGYVNWYKIDKLVIVNLFLNTYAVTIPDDSVLVTGLPLPKDTSIKDFIGLNFNTTNGLSLYIADIGVLRARKAFSVSNGNYIQANFSYISQ